MSLPNTAQDFWLDSECPPCTALLELRQRHGITQPKLSFLCALAALALDAKDKMTLPIDPDQIHVLMKLAVFLGEGSSVDTTQICKFEKGGQRPWAKAIELICYVATILEGAEVTPQELFPEQDFSRIRRRNQEGSIYLAKKNHHLPRPSQMMFNLEGLESFNEE